jgi:uncharacterized protein (TIGR03437 family)
VTNSYAPYQVPINVGAPPIFSWIPNICLPNNITATSEAYVMKIDPSTGTVQDGQWIDGSNLSATAIVVAGNKIWITGQTASPDVPFSPGVLAENNLPPGVLSGGYLSAADFSSSGNAKPAIACVLDSGNLSHTGPVSQFEIITIMGANLGPSTGVASANGGDSTLGGVSITFDGTPAQLLYVSSSQINVVVPGLMRALPASTVMQITVNGTTIQRQFPLAQSNLNLFADLSANQITCLSASSIISGFQPLAANADGSLNSCKNPAAYGSTVSFFVHGIGGTIAAPQILDIQAMVGNCSAAVTRASLINSYVYKVDVTLPASIVPCATSYSLIAAENQFPVTLSYKGAPVGPRTVPTSVGPSYINSQMPMIVWVTK